MTVVVRLMLVLLFLPALVQARTVVYEQGKGPLFAVTFPQDWFVDTDFLDEARAAGAADNAAPAIRIVEAMPIDGSKLWIGLWVIPRVSTLNEGIEYIASLDAELLTEIEATAPREQVLSGMPAKTFSGTALRHGEAVEFAVALFEPSPQVIAIALYVGRPKTWARHAGELNEIRDSLTPAKN
jgi:hypothetical protein